LDALAQGLKEFLGAGRADSRSNGVAKYMGERSKFRLHLQRLKVSHPREGSVVDLFPGLDPSITQWRKVGSDAIASYYTAHSASGYKHPAPTKWKPPSDLFISAASRVASEA